MIVAKIKMVRWMSGVTREGRIRGERINLDGLACYEERKF